MKRKEEEKRNGRMYDKSKRRWKKRMQKKYILKEGEENGRDNKGLE